MLFLLFMITFQLWTENIKAQKFRMDYMWAQAFQTYYSLHDLATDWDEAVQICKAEGTELLKPDSLEEVENLKLLMSNMRAHYEAVFIGLHDKFSDGDFVTLKGSPIVGTVLELLWAPGSPNNDTDSPEHCVIMTREGMLDDRPCHHIFPFICKIKGNDTTHNEKCDNYDQGFIPQSNGKCYNFHEEPSSWHDAYKICKVQEGHLAIITSEEEAAKITGFMNKYLINKAPNPNILLIGFSDLMFQYQYRTIKSQTLEEANYSLWAPFEEGVEEMKEKRCGAISRTGELLMTYCDLPGMFVCEKTINDTKSKF